MPYYLVKAKPQQNLEELLNRLGKNEIKSMEPFGEALTYSLENAKYIPDNDLAVWEEEDYCHPPLKMERKEVLSNYFKDIEWRELDKNDGWREIDEHPGLWESIYH